MSDALNNIEKMASEENIKDPKRISAVVTAFLEMDSRKLECLQVSDNVNYRYLVNDICSGFELDRDKVRECTMTELLVLIGLEPDVPWYEINEEEECWYTEHGLTKSFYAANHCFALAQALLRVQKYEPVINRFMKLNYRGLIQYLADRINESDDKSDQDYSRLCMKKGMRLNKLFSLTRGYMLTQGDGDEDDIDDTLTVGDVISRVSRNGNFAWLCGNEPLGFFVDRIVRAYEIINFLFMYCIRELAVSFKREQIEDLLDKCSETGDYEHLIEMRFRYCFTSLIES